MSIEAVDRTSETRIRDQIRDRRRATRVHHVTRRNARPQRHGGAARWLWACDLLLQHAQASNLVSDDNEHRDGVRETEAMVNGDF